MTRLIIVAAALALAGCVDKTPVAVADDHPANPRAASGLMEIPLAVSGYKTTDDFAIRAKEDTAPPSGGHRHE